MGIKSDGVRSHAAIPNGLCMVRRIVRHGPTVTTETQTPSLLTAAFLERIGRDAERRRQDLAVVKAGLHF